MPAERPFQDIKVVDLSWVVAGPTIGRVLADYGATVVRVETKNKPDTARLTGPFHDSTPGVENSLLYGNVNAGKLGVTLDMSNPFAKEVLLDLVKWADVLIESFSPGVMTKWGMDYENLVEMNPNLIMLSTSLMGESGPHSKFAGFGNIGSALSGYMNIAGWPDKPPKGPFGPYTDFIGPRFSLIALLSALDFQRRTNQGCHIDVSQMESSIQFIAQGVLDYFVNGRVVERIGNHDFQMAPHGVYECLPEENGEKAFIAIAIRNDEEWKRLASIMEGDSLADDERFLKAEDRMNVQDLLDNKLKNWVKDKRAKELETVLQHNGIAAHKVDMSADSIEDPQFNYQNHFLHIDHPIHDETIVEGSRYSLSNEPAIVSRPAPLFGQDNHYVLSSFLNYSVEKIEELQKSGALE